MYSESDHSQREFLKCVHSRSLQETTDGSVLVQEVQRTRKPKKILVVGLDQTGKSSLVLKFLYDFPDAKNYGPEESYHTSIKYRNESFVLNIVDMPGLDKYSPIYGARYGYKVDGYIFVYSTDNRESFNFIYKLREQLFDLHGRHLPAVLVANKVDLTDYRQVFTDEGRELARDLIIPYFEVSTKTHSNGPIRNIFQGMLKEIIRSETAINSKQFLKSWHSSKVEQLNQLVTFATILSCFIGLFFVGFGIANLLHSVEASNNDQLLWSVWQIILIISGIVLTALSLLGLHTLRQEEHDYMIIFKILCVISFIINAISGGIRAFGETSFDANAPKVGIPLALTRSLIDVTVCGMIAASLVLLVFLFWISWVASEMYVRRRRMNDSKAVLSKQLIV